jgi:hypothetical protein
MKPAWDQLMKEFSGSASVLVGDVDCTAGGKSLCDEVGVKGYPTIKYGDPANLQDYKGGRDAASLSKFASESLGPTCGPDNLDLCDAAKKAQIEEFMGKSETELQQSIDENDALSAKADKDLEAVLKSLQSQYEEATKKKDATKEEIKNSGLGMMKAVMASKKNSHAEL